MSVLDDFRLHGEWLAAAISVDTTQTLEKIREVEIPLKARGVFLWPYSTPYVQHFNPGTVAVGEGDRGWLVQLSLHGFGDKRVQMHKLNFNPHKCDPVPECAAECTCEDDFDSCDLCRYGCDCNACDLGAGYCLFHDTRHRSYYF